MNVILCLDDNKGLLFNNRRQSRDKAVLDDIFNNLNGEKLAVTTFSEKLYSDYAEMAQISHLLFSLAQRSQQLPSGRNGHWCHD